MKCPPYARVPRILVILGTFTFAAQIEARASEPFPLYSKTVLISFLEPEALGTHSRNYLSKILSGENRDDRSSSDFYK